MLVVDDQTLVRQGIRSLLQLAADVDVVGEAVDGQEALAEITRLEPDVVLLDLRMPVLDGVGVLRALAERESAPPCLVLTTFADDEALLAALRLGARGCLLKDVSLEDLVAAVRAVAAGETALHPGLTESLARGLAAAGAGEQSSADVVQQLTARELEILRLLAAGWSNAEVAQTLHLATGTVKNHVSSILLKLGVRDRTRAVLKAVELGLLRGPAAER